MRLFYNKRRDCSLSQIIETARRIIVDAEENKGYAGYVERNGRHPIHGYLNFLVRKFIYDIAYDDIAKPEEKDHALMSFNPSSLDDWFRSFGVSEKEPGAVFGRDVYLNFATDPLISSFDRRDSIVNSFSGLGYSTVVDPERWDKIVLMLPFGASLVLVDGCHSALALSLRGEYKARIRTVYDFTEAVGTWEYKDGMMVNTSTGEKRGRREVFPPSLFDLTVLLFSIGRIMAEHGIEWKEYS